MYVVRAVRSYKGFPDEILFIEVKGVRKRSQAVTMGFDLAYSTRIRNRTCTGCTITHVGRMVKVEEVLRGKA